MAEPEVRISIPAEESQDVEMIGDGAEAEDAGGADAAAGDEDDTVQETPQKPRLTFVEYVTPKTT